MLRELAGDALAEHRPCRRLRSPSRCRARWQRAGVRVVIADGSATRIGRQSASAGVYPVASSQLKALVVDAPASRALSPAMRRPRSNEPFNGLGPPPRPSRSRSGSIWTTRSTDATVDRRHSARCRGELAVDAARAGQGRPGAQERQAGPLRADLNEERACPLLDDRAHCARGRHRPARGTLHE